MFLKDQFCRVALGEFDLDSGKDRNESDTTEPSSLSSWRLFHLLFLNDRK